MLQKYETYNFEHLKWNIFTETLAELQESSCKRRREAPANRNIIIRSCYLGKYHLPSKISSSEEWSAKYHIWSEISTSDLVILECKISSSSTGNTIFKSWLVKEWRLPKSSAVGVFVPTKMCVADVWVRWYPRKRIHLKHFHQLVGRCFCIAWLILSNSYNINTTSSINFDWVLKVTASSSGFWID